MDSPDSEINSNDGLNNDYENNNNERKKRISGSSSDSPIVQDSPFFKYISNLSPIELVKGAPIAQGFSVLSSPPLVITSPCENQHENLLKRSQESNASGLGISENDDKHLSMDNPGKVDDESSNALITTIPKGCVNKDLEQVQSSSPFVCVDELLADAENEEYASSSQRKLFDHATRSSQGELPREKDKKNGGDANPDGSATSFEQGDKYSHGLSKAEVRPTKSKSRLQIPSSTDNLDIVSKSSTDNVFDLQHDGVSFSEAGHLQCGTLRRCLQFNENQWKPTADGCGYYAPVHTENNLQEPSDVLSTPTSINRQSLNPSPLVNTISVSSFSGKPVSAVARPRGIGLHLNSIVTTEPIDGARLSMQSDKAVGMKGKSSIGDTKNQFTSSSDCSSITTSVVENISSQVEMNASNVHEEAASQMSLPACSLKSSNMFNRPATPYDEKTCYSSVAESNHESSQGSPKKRRKKDPGSAAVDNYKRCNCKKSKCLKLYCECFAAGNYCGESCACQGCLNKTEYEDTVIEARQQIESRNPLAFAPKVVQRVTVSPANSGDADNSILPSSLRHKSGCNCKKSMCLKKYCECYQANVGCSDGCRCEGCRNVYGRKQDTSMRRQTSVRTADEMSEHLSEMKHMAVPTRDGALRDKAHDSPSLTRITPSLLCLDLRKNALKGHLPSGRYLISPDSNQTLSSSEEHSTSRNLQGDHMHLESKTDSINTNYNDVEQVSEKLGEGSQFSSFSGLANACNFTPLSNPFPETVVPASERQDSRYISGLQSCSGGGLSPPTSSLRWRSSPITPCTKFGGQKFHQDFDSDGKQCNTQEDDTPKILMDSSIKAVKVSSPNKKRISPPHNHNDELKTSPSESLKSGRRFVLRAVPRFPPLTSCLDSKDGNNENKTESSGS